MNSLQQTQAWKVFWAVTRHPRTLIVLGLAMIIGLAAFIPTLVKDTRSDAFLPTDEPALLYRERVKKTFGLTDPMVIAVVNEGSQGVFNPHTLELVDWLTKEVRKLDNVDPDRVTSLATENNIAGNEEGMLVEPFWKTAPDNQEQADKVRAAAMNFPLYLGSLVAKDGSGTLIVAEVHDQTKAQPLYQKLLELADRAPRADGEQIHVAGEGAVSGYLGSYIDADAQRLNPLAALIITTVLFIAFRTLRGALLPNLVVLATVASTLGLMAAAGVSFFVITNGLLPVLIGIAVADSIHIFSQYYEEKARHPEENSREIVVRTMVQMWRPITLTTLTTLAGFLGLYLASVMPPMRSFGLFAMVGVAAAWLFTVTVVPAWLSLLKLKPSPAYRPELTTGLMRVDAFGRVMTAFGKGVVRRPRMVLALAATVGCVGIYGATQLELNESRIRTFQKDEPIVQADSTINRVFDGVHYLDILIETPETEDLFKPGNLKRIEALQAYLGGLPHVGGSTSVVDYLKQMNRSLHEGRAADYALPNDKELIAQYFLLYTASGDPTDFQEEVDYDYRLANVRVSMDSGKFSDEKIVIEAAQYYIDHTFNTHDISAKLSGRVNVDYHWIKRLGETNWGSVGIALLLVWLMAIFAFRSILAGTITVLPVTLTVLIVYAVMAFTGMWLSISTSMFAAIAIGLGVDFALHTIERLQVLLRDEHRSLDDSITLLFPSTGRALLFNFLALALGFGVLATSKVVVLQEFGSIVALAVTVSFLTSLTLLPALVKVFRPRFLFPDKGPPVCGGSARNLAGLTFLPTSENNTMSTRGANNTARPIALITGGSRGIGIELAKQFARHGHDLVLVARSETDLELAANKLKNEFGCGVATLSVDLAADDAPAELFRQVQAEGLLVDVLVNNAGTGEFGPFADSELSRQLDMLQLNILSLTALTRLFLPGMLERGSGRILNVASLVAYFSGGPNWASYLASKQYVLAFTRGLAKELSGTGVSITALCPGPTATDFIDHAGVGGTRVYRWIPKVSPTRTACVAYRATMARRVAVVPGFINTTLAFMGELPPRIIAQTMLTLLLRRTALPNKKTGASGMAALNSLPRAG